MQKFKLRVGYWRAAKSGSSFAILAYRVYILPVLSFIIQMDGLPQNWSDLEAWALQQLLPGPFRWCPQFVAHHLADHGFSADFANLAEIHSAQEHGYGTAPMGR